MALADYCKPRFFRVLSGKFREQYWAVLLAIWERKFLGSPRPLVRGEAIDIAEDTLDRLAALGADPAELAADAEGDLPDVVDDDPRDTPWRATALHIVRVLADAGWLYFQTYPDQRFPVVELTVAGSRQISHMRQAMLGERLTLRSFTDVMGELVDADSSGLRAGAGRLRQLRNVVAQMNERIFELLGSIKEQATGVVLRAQTVPSILHDLLHEFERHVGQDYAVLKGRDSTPRLWSNVTVAVRRLRTDSEWLEREAAWYCEESEHRDLELARQDVLNDLGWILDVMANLTQAEALLDKRYARYVGQARRRVEAHLRQAHTLADGLRALIEAAVTGRASLAPPEIGKVLTVAPIGMNTKVHCKSRPLEPAVVHAEPPTPEELRAQRDGMIDSMPVEDVRRWLGEDPHRVVTVHVDDLPFEGDEDYLFHMMSNFYASAPGSRITLEPANCGTWPSGCSREDVCPICTRFAGPYSTRRGLFTIVPPIGESA